jgi:hypothetical protein
VTNASLVDDLAYIRQFADGHRVMPGSAVSEQGRLPTCSLVSGPPLTRSS